ncbi:MAG: hypothetical protein IJ658_03815 [Kiritimatiellae bacterium]|nr:hypothetical protein [Kiritimatiellia bacterium]
MKCKLILAAALAAAGAGASGPIVRNGGFEAGGDGDVAGWRTHGKYAFRAGEGINGTGAFYYENGDPKYYGVPGQKIQLTPGKRYKFSVWIRTEDLTGDESGASICVEWCGADGKWLGGAYAGGVKGTKFWTKVDCMTPIIPEKAHTFHVAPYVRKGMTGKAWFDDVTVTPVEPKVVSGVCSTAYRNMAAAGDVTFRALLERNGAVPPERVVFRYLDADGHMRFAPADAKLAFTVPVASLKMGRQKVGASAYAADGGLLGTVEMVFTRVAQLPQRTVWFDAQGRTIIDGKPFFPLGMYWGGITTNKLEIYAKGPFNCLMPYASPSSKDLMDLCQAHGIKVIYSVKDIYSGTRWAPKGINTEADEVRYIKDRVTKFKDHPALLAWYLNDEMPLTMLPRLTARRDLMEELDPGHPGWVVLYQYDQIQDYLPSFDVIGTDPYPIPQPAGRAALWTRATARGTAGCKPLWQVPQAFDWAAYKKTPEEKKKCCAPTEAELRSMCWQCIACGANGLVMYSWFDLWKEPNGVPFARRWAEVCRVGEEIRKFIPVLLADELSGFARPAADSSDGPLCVRAWRHEGETWLLAVNSSDKPLDAQVALSDKCSAATAAFGPAPKLVDGGRKLAVPLGPLEPALVRVR